MSETLLFGPEADNDWVGGPGVASSLKRYWLVILAAALVAALAGYAVGWALPAQYEAQANLYLRDPGSPSILTLNGTNQSQGDHTVFMATQAGLAGSDEVLGRALQLLKRGGTPEDLRRSVAVAPSADLASIMIRASSSDPLDAANVANAVGNAYQQVAAEHVAADAKTAIARLQLVMDQRNAELDAVRAQVAQAVGPDRDTLERKAQHVADLIGSLQVNQDQIASQAALYGAGVQSFLPASPPTSSSSPTPLSIALLGAVFGLLAAGGWAWWAAARNRRVEAGGDAAAILGVPLIAETPRLGGRRGPNALSSPPEELDPTAAEAYHFVLTALEHALSRIGGKAVAVASAGPGDGKTMTVLNLALAARREGRKVLLVDGDERTRRLSQLCRASNDFEVLGVSPLGDEIPALAVSRKPTPRPRSSRGTVLQIGPNERNGKHPAVFFRSRAFGKLLSFSGAPDDLVLIDTPALLDVSEAVTIADHADAVLLVVNHGTSVADLRRARERLAFTDTPVIGYLLNRGAAPRAYVANGTGNRSSLANGLLHRWPAKKPYGEAEVK